MARLFDVVRELSGQMAAISIPRPYIKFCEGNHTHAAVLSQLVFWSSTKADGEWFYKANDELADELCLSVDQVRYAIRQLKKRLGDVIQTKVKKANGVPTTHYQLAGDQLVNLLFPTVEPLSQMDSVILPDGNGNITDSNWEYSQNHGSGNITESINRSKPYTNKQISSVPSKLETANVENPVLFEIPLKGKHQSHSVTQSDLFELRELYPAVDIAQQLRNMIGWCTANPTRQKTKHGINKFIHAWLCREQDKSGPIHQGAAVTAPRPNPVAQELQSLDLEINNEQAALERFSKYSPSAVNDKAIQSAQRKLLALQERRKELLEGEHHGY